MDNKATNENIAGILARKFIKHPLTLMLSLFILAMGYISLQSSAREANPQIVVAGGTVLVPYPGVKADEIQNLIIKPLERRLQEIPNVENIYGIAQDNMAIFNIQFYLGVNFTPMFPPVSLLCFHSFHKHVSTYFTQCFHLETRCETKMRFSLTV